MENYSLNIASVMERYPELKNVRLESRYVNLSKIAPELQELSSYFKIREAGKSAMGAPVHLVEAGKGTIKILAWSQMHGNESTTTKAIFDVFNAFSALKDSNEVIDTILSNCCIRIIPMLNPDGARAYTRVNANGIDLNRDASNQEEVESQILRKEFEDFQPHFCFNLHDQRTIFSAGAKPNPATLSFLAPAMDEERSINLTRKRAMQAIVAIFDDLQAVLPGRIGRYDDAFNINCTGDTYQSMDVPTILFEAGHSPGDYRREKTREYVFAALFSVFAAIAKKSLTEKDYGKYEEIPQNEKLFKDIIIRNVKVDGKNVDVSLQFKEVIMGEDIDFIPVVEEVASHISEYGHREIDFEGEQMDILEKEGPAENVVVDKVVLKGEIVNLKPY